VKSALETVSALEFDLYSDTDMRAENACRASFLLNADVVAQASYVEYNACLKTLTYLYRLSSNGDQTAQGQRARWEPDVWTPPRIHRRGVHIEPSATGSNRW
jgi:hypothetical protein